VEGRLAAYAGSIGEVRETKREKDRTFKPLLDDALAQAQRRDLAVHIELLAGPPADVITRYAEAHRHDLIVIAHRRRGLGGYLRGSTADRSRTTRPARS
jgi:nucleotide-binding universal stress UspA family protein